MFRPACLLHLGVGGAEAAKLERRPPVLCTLSGLTGLATIVGLRSRPDGRIAADDRDALHDCLCDQQAVERITVMHGKLDQCRGVAVVDVQNLETVAFAIVTP